MTIREAIERALPCDEQGCDHPAYRGQHSPGCPAYHRDDVIELLAEAGITEERLALGEATERLVDSAFWSASGNADSVAIYVEDKNGRHGSADKSTFAAAVDAALEARDS